MLFWKECKKSICSLTFILYAAAVIVMYISQFASELDSPLAPPQPGEAYGSIEKEVPEILMPAAVESLLGEYLQGSYTAYPILTYKEVKLKESDSEKMADILEELTGITKQELDDFTGYEAAHYEADLDEDGNSVMTYIEAVLPAYQISEEVSYERFKELMAQADKIIGGGSKYSEAFLVTDFSRVPMTYEEALEEYEEVTDERKIAESYSRLYCDYIGIVISILPVFVCAGFWQMDKRSRMEQLIYSRKISSVKLVLTRYLAMVCCMSIPVILTFLHALAGVYRLYPEKNIYFGKAAGLALLWLLPGIMIVSGIGAFLSEMVSPILAILVQSVWWYVSLEANKLTGSITKYTLIIRHNNLYRPALFAAQMDNFIWNRIGYTILSLLVLALLIAVYDKVRKRGFLTAEYVLKGNGGLKWGK